MVESAIGVWIVGLVQDFIDLSPENTLRNKPGDKAFGTPLVGFSRVK